MAEVLFTIPPQSVAAVDKDGRFTDGFYRTVQELVRRIGGPDFDKVDAAFQAADGAAIDNIAGDIVPGTYGNSTRVCQVTIATADDGINRVSRVRQVAIAFPSPPAQLVTSVAGQTGDVLPVQTGWPVAVAPTMSAGYVQAEAQAQADLIADLINSLRALGTHDD